MSNDLPKSRQPGRNQLRITVTVDGIDDRGGALEAGLQDTSGGLDAGTPTADGSIRYETDASIRRRPDGAISYSGKHVHGPSRERFLYLSYRRKGDGPEWVRRVKILLPTWADTDVRGLEAHVHDRHASRAQFADDGWRFLRSGQG